MHRRFSPLFLLFSSLCAYGATVLDTPLKNEQQRQIFEQQHNVDTTIPSSDFIKEDVNQTVSVVDTTCYETQKFLLHDVKLFRAYELLPLLDKFVERKKGMDEGGRPPYCPLSVLICEAIEG